MLQIMLWPKMKIPNPNTCKAALCQYITLRRIYFCVCGNENTKIYLPKRILSFFQREIASQMK